MSREPVRVFIPPIAVDVDGARCVILEVTKSTDVRGETVYHVSVFCECCGYRSPVFTVDARTNEELQGKLRAEVAKMKLLVRMGVTHPFTHV